MKKILSVLFCLLASCAFGADYTCEKTPTGAKLMKDGTSVVWELCAPLGDSKPCIHPVTLPDGRDITAFRPKDHVWHLGLWFSWKHMNGVNYWEPSDGKTCTKSCEVEIQGTQATARLTLEYRNQTKPDELVLTEEREILFSAPDDSGSYTITSRHHFTAGKQDVTFDRTPPHSHGGGYAGFALRMPKELDSQFTVTSENGENTMAEIRKKPASWVDYRDPKNGLGVRVEVIQGTPQTRFYAQKSNGYCFINPSPILDAPMTLPADGTLDLEYKVQVGALPSNAP